MQHSVSRPIAIVLASGTETEQQAGGQLLGLFANYPLDRWRYAERVVIEDGVLPHSHPVLTLNTQYRHDPRHMLAEYLHEQLHWFTLLVEASPAASRAIDEFRTLYPDLPIELPDGCGSEFSNILHVLVCYLEFHAVSELLGSDEARHLMSQKHYYRAIYRLVLDDEARIREVVERLGALPPPLPPPLKTYSKY